MTINMTAVEQKFYEGMATGGSQVVGAYIASKLIPAAEKTAEKVDAYLTSFPIETCKNDSNQDEVVPSIPERIVLYGGMGAFLLGASQPLLIATTVTATAMKARRMYKQNQCNIM